MPSLLDVLEAIEPLTETEEGKKGKRTSAFIPYPKGHKGHQNAGTEVQLTSDELFQILFGPDSPVGEKSRELAGSKDYWESLWYPTQEEALKSLRQHADNSAGGMQSQSSATARGLLESTGAMLKGRVRVNVCHARHLGREAYTFERERCLEASEGGTYELEICVRSTAVSAERFRCVFLHRIVPLGPHTSRWTVTYDIFFVEKTNFIFRSTIEAGAHSAIRKNTETMQKTVQQCAQVKPTSLAT